MPYDHETCLRARQDFPALKRVENGRPLVFLDGPAGTQVPAQVIGAMNRIYETCNTNTHGNFVTSRELDQTLWSARQTLATFLGAEDASSISLGHNMTTLAFSLSHAFERIWRDGDEVVITQLDHEANREPWLRLRDRGVMVREVTLNRDGRLDMEDLARQITPLTRLVAIGAASNALGTVNDIRAARELSSAVGAWLLVDAVHYAPHFPIDVAAIDPDFLLCSAYKFYGPHIGILYTRPGLLETLPTDVLRTQNPAAPYRIETGTLNHAAIAGAQAAVEYIASWGEGETLRERLIEAMTSIAAYEHELAGFYYERVMSIEGVRAWGPDFSTGRRTPTISITIEGLTPAEAAARLGEQGLCVWDGDFYAARAVEVLGLAEHGGLLRVGVLMYNTQHEIERLLEAIETLVTATR